MMRPANFYAANPLDRAGSFRKNEKWLADRLMRADSQFVVLSKNKNLVSEHNGAPRAHFLLASEVAAAFRSSDASLPVFLGLAGDQAFFALDLMDQLDLATDNTVKFVDLRGFGANLPAEEAAILAEARGLVYWHQRHRFCGVCGTATLSTEGGHVRRCTNPACATSHFPRTDPAVIMLVQSGGECLLGRQASFPAGMHSTLAGFVEPGESLEEAVQREVMEEVGIAVTDVTYHSSQPWPFPSSIMLGFYAVATNREIHVDMSEIDEARWYSREELMGEYRKILPTRSSIARRLIDGWIEL